MDQAVVVQGTGRPPDCAAIASSQAAAMASGTATGMPLQRVLSARRQRSPGVDHLPVGLDRVLLLTLPLHAVLGQVDLLVVGDPDVSG